MRLFHCTWKAVLGRRLASPMCAFHLGISLVLHRTSQGRIRRSEGAHNAHYVNQNGSLPFKVCHSSFVGNWPIEILGWHGAREACGLLRLVLLLSIGINVYWHFPIETLSAAQTWAAAQTWTAVVPGAPNPTEQQQAL